MKFKDIPQFMRCGHWECDYSINRFVAEIERMEKKEGLILNPDFQRGHVWSEDQQIKYVEFILQGGKTGKVVYLNHPNWISGRYTNENDFVCVDGLQRITALKRFIHNEIKIFWHYYNEFKGNLRIMHNMKINVNDLQTRKEVLQWYIEMNEGGTPHTQSEIDKVKELLRKEQP